MTDEPKRPPAWRAETIHKAPVNFTKCCRSLLTDDRGERSVSVQEINCITYLLHIHNRTVPRYYSYLNEYCNHTVTMADNSNTAISTRLAAYGGAIW